MKFPVLYLVIALMGSSGLFAQTGYNADNESQGRNPSLQYAFQQLNSKRLRPVEKANIVGSPFLSEGFMKTEIYSEGGLEGHAYSRYDGYNEEVQLKKDLGDSEISMLLQRANIYCVVGGKTIVFREYYDKKGKFQQGHLFKIFETDDITLFERKMKKYKDGKEAVNSLQMSVPNKFVAGSELYFMKDGEKIQFLKTSKKEIVGLFKDDAKKAEAVKKFISGNGLNLKATKDVLQLFNYYKTL